MGGAAAADAHQQATGSDVAAPVGQYNDAEFLMGHGSKWRPTEKEWFRIDEAYVSQARRWVEKMGGHFASLNDLYVHAVVREVMYTLPGWEGDVEESTLGQLKQIGEVCAKEEFELRFIKVIDRIGAIVAGTLELPGGKIEVGSLLRRIRKHIDTMRPSFHKSYFEKMFTDRFQAYLNAGTLILETGGTDEEDESAMELPALMQQVLGDEEESSNE